LRCPVFGIAASQLHSLWTQAIIVGFGGKGDDMDEELIAPLGRVAMRRIEQGLQSAFLWPSTGPRARGFSDGDEIVVADAAQAYLRGGYPFRLAVRVTGAQRLRWSDLTPAHATALGASDLARLTKRWDSHVAGTPHRSKNDPEVVYVTFEKLRRIQTKAPHGA
jgi:hypothetical protein